MVKLSAMCLCDVEGPAKMIGGCYLGIYIFFGRRKIKGEKKKKVRQRGGKQEYETTKERESCSNNLPLAQDWTEPVHRIWTELGNCWT